jgi:2-polyprenyl-6-hydroxyphenyl methylase/3-demethylubiquinone-9 3-methyltransferase
MANAMHQRGYEVLGIDSSESGIQVAQSAYPKCRFAVGSVYDDLASVHGRFPVVVSLEVIEHLYSPRRYCEALWGLLEPGGLGVISTPFHGYWKNLALAATNRFDAHFSPLWEGGPIKFWSQRTLGALLSQQGFRDFTFSHVGRVPPFAKSLVVAFRRPVE